MQGKIKSLPPMKNYGFIEVPGQSSNVFFHEEQLVGVSFADLHEGDMLTFDIKEEERNGEKKTSAVNVQRASDTGTTPTATAPQGDAMASTDTAPKAGSTE